MYTQTQLRARKAYVDAVGSLPVVAVTAAVASRNDQETGMFAEHLVISTQRTLYEHSFPERKWVNGGLVSKSTSDDPGAMFTSYVESINSGEAQIVADNATDIPLAELTGRNNIQGVKTVGIGVQYSTQELRTARFQGLFDLASRKSFAAREANDLALNNLIRTGSAASGLEGITNHSGIIVVPSASGAWTTATAAVDIRADFSTMINTIINSSDGVEVPNTVVMPIEVEGVLRDILNTPTGGSDKSVFTYLRENYPMITRWETEFGMKTASAAGARAILVYNDNRLKVESIFPMMMSALPPTQSPSGLVVNLNFETRFGGIRMPRPRSVLRMDGV